MTLTAQKLPKDFVTEPTATEWNSFLHPGAPDEPSDDDLLDERSFDNGI
jgi:hypothetical protein